MNTMSIIPARVVEIKQITEEVYYLKAKPISYINNINPFNFFMIWIPRIDELPLSIAYLYDNEYSFLFKVKGIGTQTLSKVLPGQFIGLKGPLGRGFIINDPLKKALVIAGGIGIAPIPLFIDRAMCKELDVIWGVKKGIELFDIDSLFPGIRGKYNLIIATEDCSHGMCGTVLDVLKSIDIRNYDIIIAVGPKPMLNEICSKYIKINKDIYVALETLVKCGIGVCGSCYIPSSDKLLCRDGPVFKCSEVI